MKFIIAGNVIEITSLSQVMDDEFVSLHEAYFGQGSLNWDRFESLAIEFFDEHPDPSQPEHDSYFNNFTVIWRHFLAGRNFEQAEHIWRMALSPALAWEDNSSGNRVHKGTPYYFWGWTALQRGDLDKAYALLHLAVGEDVATTGRDLPDTPAYWFASLDYEKAARAFGGEWLYSQMKYLDDRQNTYSSRHNRPFQLADFKSQFLNTPPSVDIAFLFAYTVARLMQLHSVPARALSTGFAGQLEANLLFDLALVIDGAIKNRNPNSWRFIDHAEYLLRNAGQPLNNAQLGDINQAFNNDFDNALSTILDGQFTLSNNVPLSVAQTDVALAYGIRNRGAHDVTSAPTVWKRFSEIDQALFSALFLTVDFLY